MTDSPILLTYQMLWAVYYIVSGLAYIVPFFNEDAKECVFKPVILPHLIYEVPGWDYFILQKDKDRIVKITKYMWRFFTWITNLLY